MTNNNTSIKCISVINSFDLLMKIIDEPTLASPMIAEALKSQGAFAALNLPEYNIIQMSLNSMKTYSNHNSNITWDALNKYREAAKLKYQQHQQLVNKPGRGSRADLAMRYDEIKADLKQKCNSIIQYIDMYQDLLTISKDHALHDSSFAARIERHIKRYLYLNELNGQIRLSIIHGKRHE